MDAPLSEPPERGDLHLHNQIDENKMSHPHTAKITTIDKTENTRLSSIVYPRVRRTAKEPAKVDMSKMRIDEVGMFLFYFSF
jgi:hypothetical protein